MNLRNIWHFFENLIDPLFQKIYLRLEPVYWIRAHTFDRYHVINISGIDGYRWGWSDADHRIELAMEKIFLEFYEKEYPGMIEWDADTEREIEELYKWFTVDRKKMNEMMNDYACELPTLDECLKEQPGGKTYLYDPPADRREQLAIFMEMDEAIEKKKDEMLTRLLNLRRRLWT